MHLSTSGFPITKRRLETWSTAHYPATSRIQILPRNGSEPLTEEKRNWTAQIIPRHNFQNSHTAINNPLQKSISTPNTLHILLRKSLSPHFEIENPRNGPYKANRPQIHRRQGAA